MPERLNVQADFSTLTLVNVGLGVFLWFIWLSMVKAIRRAVKYKFTEVQANIAQKNAGA